MKYLIILIVCVLAIGYGITRAWQDATESLQPAVETAPVQPRPFRLRPGPTMPPPEGYTERGRG